MKIYSFLPCGIGKEADIVVRMDGKELITQSRNGIIGIRVLSVKMVGVSDIPAGRNERMIYFVKQLSEVLSVIKEIAVEVITDVFDKHRETRFLCVQDKRAIERDVALKELFPRIVSATARMAGRISLRPNSVS